MSARTEFADQYVSYTVAEMLGLWPHDERGGPVGRFGLDALMAGDHFADSNYREFGRRLLAARTLAVPEAEQEAFVGLLAAAVDVISRSRSVLQIRARGDVVLRLLAFWADAVTAELIVEPEGYTVHLERHDDPIAALIDKYLESGFETAFVEHLGMDGARRGAAWGQGSAYELSPERSDWHPVQPVPMVAACRWMADAVAAGGAGQ